MATQAISAYGISLWVGDGVPTAAISVTGGSATSPIILTTAAHGLPAGHVSVATVSGVTGLGGANGTWQVQATDATHLALRGTAGTGSYGGGGTVVFSDTFTMVACITDLQDAGAGATLVDVSCHDGNGWASRIPTFLQGNTIRVMYNLIPSDPTHAGDTGFPFLMVSRARRNWLIVFPDANRSSWAFEGFVASNRDQAPVAGALTGTATIEMTEAPLLAVAA